MEARPRSLTTATTDSFWMGDKATPNPPPCSPVSRFEEYGFPPMAREVTTRIVSDITGEPVPEEEAVSITISFSDHSRGRYLLDAAESEVVELIGKGRHVRPRPRRRRASGE
jgi:hypothetical protein